MIKKVYITESEREKILSLHRQLNEQTTFTISGIVLSREKQEPILGVRVVLSKDGATVSGTKTEIDGNFTLNNVEKGNYTLTITDTTNVFNSIEETITVDGNITDKKIYLSKAKELEEVKVKEITLTMLDFSFFDYKGSAVNNVDINLKSEETTWNQKLQTSNGKISVAFDSSGNIINGTDIIEFNKSIKNKLFDAEGKPCSEFKKLNVDIKVEGQKKLKKEIEYCLKNASYKASGATKNKDIEFRTPTRIPTRLDSYLESNNFKIVFEKNFKTTFKIVSSEDKPLSNVVVNFYSDESMTNLIESLQTDGNGVVIFEKTAPELGDSFGEIGSKIKIYISTISKEYKPFTGAKNIDVNKEENIKITLKSVKEPKPAKPMSFRECKKEIRKYYRNYITTMKKGDSIEDAGGEQFIMDSREQVKWCYINYQKRYSDKYQRAVRRLRNTATNYDAFEINFTIQQQQDIYKENYTMSLRNSIRKVIFEQNEINKSNFTEKKIIKNRLNFVLENSNRRNYRNNLLSESRKLVRNGYNRGFVKESFMDIMTGMKDPKTFLTDIKNQLGQKIADTVKDKQQEHELIIGAFNELDPSVIERAFKENKTEELSEIIATKALENYKTQFGEGGIMGSLVASVDLGKFKTEVSKLLQTAIDQMNTEMTDKIEKSASGESE